jgi:membrane protein implicated in regulation of membrane protease activity
MEETPWSAGALGKYLVLQMPSWILLGVALLIARRWIEIPLWLFAALLGGWVAKDLLLYPFVWRAYASGGSTPKRPSPESRGIVIRELSPSGYVEVDGELWRAEASDPQQIIPQGNWVRVRDVRGITLVVEPLSRDRNMQTSY